MNQRQNHDHEARLSTLARCDATRLKAFAEVLITTLNEKDTHEINVIENRSGLVMLPMRDTAQGTHFHLGEVLMSEARIAFDSVEGYGMRRGRDLEAAMAMAIVDLSVALGLNDSACAEFINSEAEQIAEQERKTLCQVEATRVDMETF